MISQKNVNGDTPLHIASKRGSIRIVELLVNVIFDMVLVEGEEVDQEFQKRPWRIQNLEGNTPFHEALVNGKVEVAMHWVNIDPQLATFVNKSQETPLHLAIKYNVDGDKKLAIDTIEQLNKQRARLTYKGSCLANEPSLSIIKLLLQTHKPAIHNSNRDGLTPILCAAQRSYIDAIKLILEHCPEASEIRDRKGRTMLHLIKFQSYEEAKKLLKVPQILALKDEQDNVGNTPAHIIVFTCISCKKDVDIGVMRALLESSTNFTIKNKQGVSAATLFHQQVKARLPNQAVLLHQLEIETDEILAENKQKLKDNIWDAIIYADMKILREKIDILENLLLDDTLILSDLLYVLLQACNNRKNVENLYNDVEHFIKEILESNSILSCQTNSLGDTLLHILVQFDEYDISGLLITMKQCFENAKQRVAHSNEELYCPPWKVKNIEGNTPLHIILSLAPQAWAVKFLLNCDANVATYVNNLDETPLHILCDNNVFKVRREKDYEEVIREMTNANTFASFYRDANGLTPLLRAAKGGKLDIVKQICLISPDSTTLRDNNGNTIWHLMDMSSANSEDKETIRIELCKIPRMNELSFAEDNEGTQPLDKAIKRHNYNLAQVLSKVTNTSVYSAVQDNKKFEMVYSLFLLRFATHFGGEYEKTLWEKLREVGGEKSIFGVPRDEIKDYTQTIGVVAVLLATVAFTAAFTVPGGPKGDAGYPILLANKTFLIKAAYWVFMISDILTMCLSMMVLFCLLWIITGDHKEKLILTDITILLLNASFITTMVALMMGVFASTYGIVPQLAIFTCVICSAVLLLLQKWVVMFPLQYVFVTGYLIFEVIWNRFCAMDCKKKK